MLSVIRSDKLVPIVWKSTIEIRNMKPHEDNMPGSKQGLQNREKAHQDARKNTQEVEELKMICCSETERTQELRTDDFSRHELQESQSTVNQLTVQIQELQDGVR